MDLVQAIKFPFDDEDWPVKIAVGSLVTLVPVVGWIGSLGYQIAVARNVTRGERQLLPGTDDLGQVFTDGVMAFVASLLYAVPLLPFWCLVVAFSALADGSGASDLAVACISLFVTLAMILYAIPAAAMYWIGVMRYGETGNFSEFTRFGALWREARGNVGLLVTLLLYNLALSLILSLVAPFALITCIGIFVLGFYSQIATGHLIGQAGQRIVHDM